MRAATRSSAPPCSKGFQSFWASSACAASATCYPSCSAAPLPWPSGFSWAAPLSKAGRSLLAFGSNSAVKRTASPPLTLAVRSFWVFYCLGIVRYGKKPQAVFMRHARLFPATRRINTGCFYLSLLFAAVLCVYFCAWFSFQSWKRRAGSSSCSGWVSNYSFQRTARGSR